MFRNLAAAAVLTLLFFFDSVVVEYSMSNDAWLKLCGRWCRARKDKHSSTHVAHGERPTYHGQIHDMEEDLQDSTPILIQFLCWYCWYGKNMETFWEWGSNPLWDPEMLLDQLPRSLADVLWFSCVFFRFTRVIDSHGNDKYVQVR